MPHSAMLNWTKLAGFFPLGNSKKATILNNEAAREKYLRLLAQSPEVVSMASVADLASYLGVTRRTLSRIRREVADK